MSSVRRLILGGDRRKRRRKPTVRRRLRIGYVAREAFFGLTRNASLAVAAVVTVALSLSLVGGTLVFRQGVDNATSRWQEGVEFVVFMEPTAPPEVVEAMAEEVDAHAGVRNWFFVDQQAALDEFNEMFADSPEMTENVTADILPASFRIAPVDSSSESVEALVGEFEQGEGVRQVVAAYDAVRTVQRFSSTAGTVALAVAILMLVSAAFLILNAIRSTMFARRREIRTMRLVGAANWYVRLPFVVEGVVQGLVGGLVAVGSVHLVANMLERLSDGSLALLQGFRVSSDEVAAVSVAVVVVGVLIGALGSAVASVRFLRAE